MIIRPGITADIPQVLELIKEFHEESLQELFGFKYSEEAVLRVVDKYVKASLVAVQEDVIPYTYRIVGVIAGEVVEYPASGEKIFQEVIWFVSKHYRSIGIRLIKELELYAKTKWGCSKLAMVCMGNSQYEQLRAFYEGMGFIQLETHFVKNL